MDRCRWHQAGRFLYRNDIFVGVMDTHELAHDVVNACNQAQKPATRKKRFMVEVEEDVNQMPVSRTWIRDLLLKTRESTGPLSAGNRRVTVTAMEDE